MKQYDIKLIRDRKKEIHELFKVAASSGESFANIGEDYVMVVDAAARLADWAERAQPYLRYCEDRIAGQLLHDNTDRDSIEALSVLSSLIEELEGK